MDNNKPIFPDGVRVKKVADTLFSLSIKVNDFAEWAYAHQNENGYLNLNLCKSKDKENWYCKLNTWKPNTQEVVKFSELGEEEEIPF